MSTLASAIELMLNEYDIYDVDTLAANVGGVQGDVLAAWLKSDAVKTMAAADTPSCLTAATPAATTPPPDVALQLQLMRDELRSIEWELAGLRIPATSPTIHRGAVAQSWQRRLELPSLRAAAAADRKAAAREKKAAAIEMAEATAAREAAAALKHAAEHLMETAKAKLIDGANRFKAAWELREATHAGFERQAAEAAAVAAAQAEREGEKATIVQLQSELSSVRAAAAAAEEERAKAEREIERSRERIFVLQRAETDLMCEVEAAYGESQREWVSLSFMRARCTCGALTALPGASSEA